MGEDKKSTAICRACLSYDFEKVHGKGVSIFDMYNDFVIWDTINTLTNVSIKQGDGLPDKICPICLKELESAYKFKQKCENTDEVLLSAVNDAPNFETTDIHITMKKEYLDDDQDYSELDDNITLADLQATDMLKTEQATMAPSKPGTAVECHDCGGSFKSKCKLRVHWKKVHFAENLKCTNCLRMFKSYAALNSHKKRNVQSCAIASKVRIEGEGRSRVFHCKDCNYHSLRIKDIGAHIVIHSGERPFSCNLCDRQFTQLSSLNAHKEGAHKIYKVEGTCYHCGKHIKGRARLYRHLKSHNINRYPCIVCNLQLKNRSCLKNHMKRHSGVKAYSCEICATSFYTLSELGNHRSKVHLKSKKYKCEVCNYTTFSHGSMKRHRPRHTASNFACNVCGMFVDNEYQLELHKKRHTDRNCQCPHCNKTYFSRKNLSAHVRSKHRIVMLNGPAANLSVKSECSA